MARDCVAPADAAENTSTVKRHGTNAAYIRQLERITLAVSSAFRKLKNHYPRIVPVFEDFCDEFTTKGLRRTSGRGSRLSSNEAASAARASVWSANAALRMSAALRFTARS